MRDCQMDKMLVSALADGELTGAERAEVEAHVASCAPCQADLAALKAVREEVARLPVAAVSAAEWDSVWEGVSRRLPRPKTNVILTLWARPRPILAVAAVILALLVAGLITWAPWRATAPIPPSNNFLVASADDVRVESLAYNSEDYEVSVKRLKPGGGPVLWLMAAQNR